MCDNLQLTTILYLTDWSPGDGGELVVADTSRSRRVITPARGQPVAVDGPKAWHMRHAYAPKASGPRLSVVTHHLGFRGYP